MADAIHGPTQTGATKQDLITALVQRELKQAAILASTISDVSQFAVPGAKTISFPKLGSFAVQKRPLGTAGDATVIASAVDTLALDQNAYVAYVYDSSDMIQTTMNWQLELAKRAATAHGRGVDVDIIALLRLISQEVAETAVNENLILEFREALKNNYANMQAVTILASVAAEKTLLGIDGFVRADQYGSNVVQSGELGRLYGMPVITHTGLLAGEIFAYESSAAAIGFQKAPSMSEQMANEYGTGGKRVAMDQLYGVKGLQIAQNGAGAGLSALAWKIGA